MYTAEVHERYMGDQRATHAKKVDNFLVPILHNLDVESILDVGCGVGLMVQRLNSLGYRAQGVDLPAMSGEWPKDELQNYAVVHPDRFSLPFPDGQFDFIYSLGVIEHVGTIDGNAARHEDYHEIRRQWLREVFRVLKPGKSMLIGGPNKGFPIDTHGPDHDACWLEKFSRRALKKVTLHRTFGNYFLWNYSDFHNYLRGLPYALRPMSVANYYEYAGSTPRRLRGIFKAYVDNIPRFLLGTGFNPWALALISKF